jgi:hypothetical protein
MSYSILYDKQFIKVGDNLFIPMVQCGDNNVYEAAGNGRKRARSWSNDSWIANGKTICTREEIESRINQIRDEVIQRSEENVKEYDESWSYQDKRFGYHTGIAIYGKHTSNTTFGNFKGFYMSGCDGALTIEELLKHNVNVCVRLPYYNSVKEEIEKKGLECKQTVYLKTTEELLNTIKEWDEYYGNKITYYIDFGSDWGLENIKRERSKTKQRKEKQYIQTKEYYVLEGVGGGMGYFVKNLKRGYRYAYTSTGAKKFINEKSANKFHKSMKNKDLFKVIKKEKTYEIAVSV